MPLSELDHVWVEVPFFSDALDLFPNHVTIDIGSQPPTPEADEAISKAQAVLASSIVRYNGELFGRLPNLRIVTRTGIGVDNVNLADATKHGVVICNTPDGPTESTAEHTVAMLLALAKRLRDNEATVPLGDIASMDLTAGSAITEEED